MEKFHVDPKNDIATEKYQGPSALVAGAGYVYIFHWVAAFAGAAALAAIGLLAPGRVNAFKEACVDFGAKHKDATGLLKRITGNIAYYIPKSADWAAEKMMGAANRVGGARLGKAASEDTKSAALFTGGIGFIAGFLGSYVWGFAKGHKQSNAGKTQFIRAQEEIKELRDRNDDLNRINDDLHEKYVKAKQRWNDAAEANQENSESKAEPTKKETTTDDEKYPAVKKLVAATHQGTLGAEQSAEAAIG